MSILRWKFPFLCQSPSTSLPRGTIHWELWLRSQSTFKTFYSTTGSVKPLDVHRGPLVRMLLYHSCPKCGGQHRAVNCNFHAYYKKGTINPPAPEAIPQPNLLHWGFQSPQTVIVCIFSFLVYPFGSRDV